MNAAVCSVGTEIVEGDQVDSNAAWLSQRLKEMGVDVHHHVAVDDHPGRIVEVLRWLVARVDAVIVGGGLGPTPDDVTREAVAELCGQPLEHRDDLEEAIRGRFADLGVRMPATNLRQARTPRDARPFAPVGTAPGFRVAVARPGRDPCILYVLPGVPWELQAMFDSHVLPDLAARTGGGAIVTRVVHVNGMGESAVAEAVSPLMDGLDVAVGPAVTFLATGREVQVRVTARGSDLSDARAQAQPVVDAIRERLGRAVAGIDDQRLEEVVGELLREAGETVAFAESATAGAVASRMAEVPGASEVMKGGAVVYATDAKSEVLQVPRELIEEHGAVSDAVTVELATRVRKLFGADWGVGTTGVAGPGTQAGKPVGTVVWAVAGPAGELRVRSASFPGDRETIRRRLASAALEGLRQELLARRSEHR